MAKHKDKVKLLMQTKGSAEKLLGVADMLLVWNSQPPSLLVG